MNKFTNINIKKLKKKKIKFLVLGIFLIGISFVFWSASQKAENQARKEITDLNSIILSSKIKEDKLAFLDIRSEPYKFAVYNDTPNSYYIVSDGQYLYVVYMSPEEYQKLSKKDLRNNKVRIKGITQKTPEDIKKLAIEAYNRTLEETDQKLTLADYDNYFGSVYLDMITKSTTIPLIFLSTFFLILLFGTVIFLSILFELVGIAHSIKKLEIAKIEELDQEMNNSEAIFYNKANLYLTKNYIISFENSLKLIAYKNILWIYPYTQRTNGIKTTQSIKILTNNGKTTTIATMALMTKKKKEIYAEIWNTITSKNDQILIGFTKENIDAMNQKVKEIRKQQKK